MNPGDAYANPESTKLLKNFERTDPKGSTAGKWSRPQDNEMKNYFSYFSTKTYVVGTQKNRLAETVLLSTLNTCLTWLTQK